jgi:oligoendopeptidase F
MVNSLAFTPESAEVASMCMEVLATNHYELIFGDTADYARVAAIYDMVNLLLQAALMCEFELALYANPEMTPSERVTLYSELMEEYRTENPYPWAYVNHFFISPHYTISYTINGIVALELWQIMQDDLEYAKEIYLDYLRDCTQRDLVMRLGNAGFSNPFARETLEELSEWLDDLFNSEAYLNPEQLKLAS